MDSLVDDDEGKMGKGFMSADELEAVDIGPGDRPRLTYISTVTPIFKDKNRMRKRLTCAPGNNRTHKLTNCIVSSQCLLHSE
jgi:hypothetical protein